MISLQICKSDLHIKTPGVRFFLAPHFFYYISIYKKGTIFDESQSEFTIQKTPYMHHLLSVFFLLFALLLSPTIFSQVTLTGKLTDKKTKEALVEAQISLLNVADSTMVKGSLVDEEGIYRMTDIEPKEYILRILSFGYSDIYKRIQVPEGETQMDFSLSADPKLIDEVTVEAKAIRVEQKGDTTQYNADAFKTAPDATVEDLITKMPGITLENGVVKAQGEEIKKVFIDGEEFFGDDATAALKNLPAEIVSKIQVYDNASDQAKFTGISDGNEAKALNIVTKPGKNQGQFGKIYGGYGLPNNLYLAGVNVNFFKGSRKISLIGMSNNVNQQNFSSEDILGVSGSSGGSGQRGGGGRGPGGGGQSENFLVGQQNGISTTHSIGINYTDKWGKKTKVTGSYFFNASQNNNIQKTHREYILSQSSGQLYDEDYQSKTVNYNHRANFKFEFTLDSMNSLILTPRFSYQGNKSNRNTSAFTQNSIGTLMNELANATTSNSNGLNASNSILWRRKFKKPQRTFSVNLSGNYSNRTGKNGQNSASHYYDDWGVDSLVSIDQLAKNATNGYGVDARFSYTEPLSKTWSSEFFYTPSYSANDADKRTNYINPFDQTYSLMDTSLSNVFNNKTIGNEAGTNFRFKKNKVNFQLGASYQNNTLINDQEFPMDRHVKLSFNNILPNARFKIDFTKTKSLMLNYRTSSRNPSVDQLQNVINNSNPLALSSGNPDLKQQYSHNIFGRFNITNIEKASNLFFFVSGQINNNFITNSTTIATNDTIIEDNIILLRGSQYTKPINLNGSWNTRGSISYGFPLVKLKLNLNFNAGVGYAITTALINAQVNQSKVTNSNGGITIASNISEKIDFSVNYQINYNQVVNTRQNKANNNYLVHNIGARFNWIIKERFVINSTYSLNSYAGLGSDFNQTIMLWNGGIGYKLLKQKQLELRVSVFDILNNNNSIARNVTQTYIEDVRSNVLNRYFMFTATYSLRNFGSKTPTTPKETKTGGDQTPTPFGSFNSPH